MTENNDGQTTPDPISDPETSREAHKTYKRMEMDYGRRDVEDTVRIVNQEMELNEDDTEIEVNRRLKEKRKKEVGEEENKKNELEKQKREEADALQREETKKTSQKKWRNA
jgi:hypothetical protein